MKKRIRQLMLLLVIAGMASIVYLLYYREVRNVEYGNFGVSIPEDYPILGMDVSHYQGDINWNQVKAMKDGGDSIQFVYIKATEGLSVEDDYKRENAIGARSVEIDYSFYHFFIPTLSAREQAAFFCEEIEGYNFDLKPVLDVEIESDEFNIHLKDSVNVFLNYSEKRLGVRPIVYTYSNLFFRYFSDMDELFWVAKYSRYSPAMDFENVICWQFSETGTVDGINEKVDLNVAKENFFQKMSR
ncbi:MAG: glycoside hydrolase family 25 protein [Crocinitomicaceae bacterium]